ncbi:GNAT family N-acetyltransferase [Lactococcus termiticola]|uniref:GNAT family acetyltransferase n=1 Tax=Lactococcus termiticola TaxID=2169526 RepID=A0A2R5HJ51_9LACT|nr:GNAT family N-acetyltransferase [Lactococcus termiticola]GBG96520.1 GNAT family acetyltransferase [Lactococcus termiticola]
MTKISYDTVKPSDIDAIMAIEEADFSPEESLSRTAILEEIQLIPDSFIVARNETSQVVGYISGPTSKERYLVDEMFEHNQASRKDDAYQIVTSLAIHPDYQGLGIATELMERLAETAKASGRQAISLTCHDYLIPYYEKHGFVNEGLSESKFAGEVWYNLVREL